MKNETAKATAVAGTGSSDNPVNKTVSKALSEEPSAASRIMEDAIRASLAEPEPVQEAATEDDEAREEPQPETHEAPPAEAEPSPEPGEGTDEGEADQPSEGDEPEPAHDDKRKEQWPESARKRVDKLTAKRRELEEIVKERDAKIAELEKAQQQKPPAEQTQPDQSPTELDRIQSADDLNRFESVASEVVLDIEEYRANAMGDREKARFEKYLTGLGLFDADSGAVDVEKLSQLHRDLRRNLRDVPKRRKVIEDTARIEPHVVQLYPYWKDTAHPDYIRAQNVLRMVPGIQRLPNWKHLVSLFLRGVDDEIRSLKEKEKPKVPTNGAPKPPPKVPGSPAAAVVPASGAAVSKDMRDRAISGSNEDRVAWVRSQLPKTITTG